MRFLSQVLCTGRWLYVGCLSALLASGMFLPRTAYATHGGEAPEGCQECHSLGAGSAISGTSYIKAGSRTLPSMLTEGWGAGDKFACTYCHSNPANDPGGVMVRIDDDFGTHNSIHYVGKSRTTRLPTNHEYVSNVDGVDFAGGVVADELDCIDCHDPALLTDGVYPNHVAPASRGGNPYMLRDVTSMDNFCRGCHGDTPAAWWTGSGKNPVTPLSHGDGTVAMTEADDTPLKTSTCTDCHDIHFSGKVKLFNDGKDGDTAIVSTDCITVCHYAGDNVGYNSDADNNYTRHGHGKPNSTYKYAGGIVDFSGSYVTLGFTCTRCHMGIDTSDTSSNRKLHIENPSTADPKDDYVQRFNLDSVIQGSDTQSIFGNLVYGICFDCHAGYDNHTGGAGNTGCQDCHDEHGEGSGVTSNYFMIPEVSRPNGAYDPTPTMAKAGVETVLYDTPRKDPVTGNSNAGSMGFYRGTVDTSGFCDNSECHGSASWWGTSLSDILGGGGTHSGGVPQNAGSDCALCHTHNGDPAGGWRANATCEGCHQDPGNPTGIQRTHQDPNESPGNHSRHAYADVIADCDECHAHNGKTVPFGTGAHGDSNVDFGGTNLGSAGMDYPGSAFTNTDCNSANGCHDSDTGEWAADDLGADACVDCHLSSGKVLSEAPTSGLHGTTTAMAHDDSFDSGHGCMSCHDGSAPSSLHVDGNLDDSVAAAFSFNAANVVAYDNSGFPVQTVCAANCHDDAAANGGTGKWRRLWMGVVNEIPLSSNNPGDAVCDNCHGDGLADASTVDGIWRDGIAPSHGTDWDGDGTGGEVLSPLTNHLACQACHGWGHGSYDESWGGTPPAHGDGNVTLNGPDAAHGGPAGTEYDEDAWTCLGACHAGPYNPGHALADSGWTVNYGDFGTFGCDSCHGPSGPGPSVVWPAGNATGRSTSYGSHLGATTAEEGDGFLGGVADWKVQCNKCHDAHYGAITVPSPPSSWFDPSGRLTGTNMQTRLGLAYATEPGIALHLGGTAQAGASEAEFCWGCHDSNNVSEWGYNTKTTPAGFPVATFATVNDGTQESHNYGWIYDSAAHTTKVSDWTQGYWLSEYDTLLERRIASVHSVSFDGAGQSSSVADNVNGSGVVDHTSPTFEAVEYLRCSYCHAVHDTFGPDGKPYLRGAWVGNPYPPGVPPRTSYNPTYTATVPATGLRTPRALSSARQKGGFFIDQNSGRPTNNTSMDQLGEVAGLCVLCHDADVNGMDFYSGSSLWIGTNGHSNSTLGGSRSSAVDLFNAHRNTTDPGLLYSMGMQYHRNSSVDIGVCYSGCNPNVPQTTQRNQLRSISSWFGTDFANWYNTTGGTIGGGSGPATRAHDFTCSKCHTPHASGLPALLIHNCLDQAAASWSNGNLNPLRFQSTNCHRKTSTSDGWHVLAPWQ